MNGARQTNTACAAFTRRQRRASTASAESPLKGARKGHRICWATSALASASATSMRSPAGLPRKSLRSWTNKRVISVGSSGAAVSGGWPAGGLGSFFAGRGLTAFDGFYLVAGSSREGKLRRRD